MRYCIKFCSNPNIVTVCVEARVSDKYKTFHFPSASEDCQPSKMVRDLLATEGVVMVTIAPYEVIVHKAEVFEWREMISAILHCIHSHLSPEGEPLKETKPPKHCRASQTSRSRLA